MLGFVVAYVLVLIGTLINTLIMVYAVYKTDEVRYMVSAILSIVIGAFMVGLIINHLILIYPVMHGR